MPPAGQLHERSPLNLGAGDPLKVLIIAVLSQATSDRNCFLAYESLLQAFTTWESMAYADEPILSKTIQAGGLANTKTHRIKKLLQSIKADRGEYSLDWLAELDQAGAYAYLMGLPGVGRKTAACVWGFGLDKPALPVDTHVYRVLCRLGITTESEPEALQAQLETDVPPEIQTNLHVLLINFGREFCRKRNPRCANCFLAGECQYLISKG